MQNYDLSLVLSKFNINAVTSPYGEGHINDTYLAQAESSKYILQRINHGIFKEPEKLMQNIVSVTEHLRGKITTRGGNPVRETLTVLKTLDGKDYCKDDNGNYFRMYIFVEDTNTYQAVDSPRQLYNSARAFGRFQNDLADFPANTLHETILNFHNTGSRFNDFLASVKNDKAGKKSKVEAEINFAVERERNTSIIVDALKNDEIPLRVTHNDTKLNNVLFDSTTDEGICVIDLDTVMPGSLLYDFGDSIRFGASTAAEDEKDLSKVECSMELFEAFTKGFLEELGSITANELELLPFGAKMMTYECGIRFLADYLDGDTYFKTHYPEQNLDRCRTQFKLVADMENKMEQMKGVVRKYAADIR